MLFGEFFNEYPYRDISSTNLDWLIKQLQKLEKELINFVSLNTITYANPIQWTITRQYKMNTVVVDPISKTAYISTKAVPLGVQLSDTNYWTPIFDLNQLSTNQNITLREDGYNILATFPSHVGDWLIWQDLLYKVTAEITTDSPYVVDYNIERYTVEMFLDDYTAEVIAQLNILAAKIGALTDLNTTDKNTIVGAINELVTKINNVNTKIGNLDNLTTSAKNNVVEALNELVTTIATEATARSQTDNTIITKIGNLANLTTSAKNNVVEALNELNQTGGGSIAKINNLDIISVKDYGAVCDGVTDDSDALMSAIAHATNKILIINGNMLISKHIRLSNPITILGNGNTVYVASGFSSDGNLFTRELFGITGTGIQIDNLIVDGSANSNLATAIIFNGANDCRINNCIFQNIDGVAIWIRANNYHLRINNCRATNCDMTERYNGGGVIACAHGEGQVTNHYIIFDSCKVANCGNGGFQMYDTEFGIINNCWVDSLNAPDNWEVGDGFMLQHNVLCCNCRATQISNAAYYVTGNNNTIIGCTAHTCGGMAVDLYTGNQQRYGNSVIGCAFENCAITAHPSQYPVSAIIAGTHQNRLLLADINITAGGNNVTPCNIVGFENLYNSTIDGVNAYDVTYVGHGLVLDGNNANHNMIRNCRLLGDYSINPYQSGTMITDCGYGWATTNISAGVQWRNQTYRMLGLMIGGSVTNVELEGQNLGAVNCVIIPPNCSITVTGSNLTYHGMIW